MKNFEIARLFDLTADVFPTKRENAVRIRTLERLDNLARPPGREER